jgi:hypothetical protein
MIEQRGRRNKTRGFSGHRFLGFEREAGSIAAKTAEFHQKA